MSYSSNLVFSELRSLLNSSTPWDAAQAAHYRTLLGAVRADDQTRLLLEEVWAPVGREEDLLVPWVRPVGGSLPRPSAHWSRFQWFDGKQDTAAWIWAGDWLPYAPSRWVRAQAWEEGCRWSWQAWMPEKRSIWAPANLPSLTTEWFALMISPPGRYWVEVLGEGVFPLDWGGRDELEAAPQGELDRIFPAPVSRFMSGGIKVLTRIFEDREHRARLVRDPSEIPRR